MHNIGFVHRIDLNIFENHLINYKSNIYTFDNLYIFDSKN